MKSPKLHGWKRWLSIAAVLLGVFLLMRGEGPPPQDLRFCLDTLNAGLAFDFVKWEVDALAGKVAFGLLAPQRFLDDGQRAHVVLDYLDHVREARYLSDEIAKAYTDPEIDDPAAATRTQQSALEELRSQMQLQGPLAEAIVGEQVSTVLNKGGFGLLHQILPPVSGLFTPLPYMLVVSPRDHIASAYQLSLLPGLTAAEQETIEGAVEDALPDYSAYVTAIGGLAAYPSMLLESSSIDWVTDVFAHEWTHHYLIFHPLGIYYDQSNETRTINETTASLMGEWAGQETVLQGYASLLDRPKQLPDPLRIDAEAAAAPPSFDFGAEMHHTRVEVDRMLSEGKIKEAEWYMEAQRRYFVAHGYRIRRLNQAYFAFHGAYASAPGASGADPIGPAVRRQWALSDTPRDFVHSLAPVTTLAELRALEPPAHN